MPPFYHEVEKKKKARARERLGLQIQPKVRDPASTVGTDTVTVIVEVAYPFVRGDSNADGEIDVSDVIRTLLGLFAGVELACHDAADANDDGVVDISDPIFTLGFLFLGTPSKLSQPYPDRGIDPTLDTIGCDTYEP